MKLKFLSCFILVTLLISHTQASITEFEKLFKLEYCDQHLILSTQDNIKLPDSNLNHIQRLYRYINLFCKLELYLVDEDSTLVIVPYNRLNLFYNTVVYIKLLNYTEDKHFIFTTAETPKAISKKSYTSSNNSAIKVEVDFDNVPIKQFLANDNTIKYLISQLEYGMLDLPSQKFFGTLLQLINTSDYLIHIDYNQQQLPCLFKGNTNCYGRYYLLSKLVTSDLVSYLHKTYNYIKNRVQNYRGKQQIKTTPLSESEITQDQQNVSEIIPPSELEITTEQIADTEITQEQQNVSETTPPSELEITTEQIADTEITQDQQNISETTPPSELEITTEQMADTGIIQNQQDIFEATPPSELETTTEQIEDTEITWNQQYIFDETLPLEPEVPTTSAIDAPVIQHSGRQQLDTPTSTLPPAIPNQVITANINLNTGKIYY